MITVPPVLGLSLLAQVVMIIFSFTKMSACRIAQVLLFHKMGLVVHAMIPVKLARLINLPVRVVILVHPSLISLIHNAYQCAQSSIMKTLERESALYAAVSLIYIAPIVLLFRHVIPVMLAMFFWLIILVQTLFLMDMLIFLVKQSLVRANARPAPFLQQTALAAKLGISSITNALRIVHQPM